MERELTKNMRKRHGATQVLAVTLVGALFAAGSTSAAPMAEGGTLLKDRTIGYVMTDRHWGVMESPGGKEECPQGFNDGPREQFKKLYPDGPQRTVMDTQLKREGEQWHPEAVTDRVFPFHEAKGKVAYGLNLDGKVDANDFVSADGEKGIDNEMYRVLGCIANYRIGGTFSHFENLYMGTYNDNRFVIEITDVDDLVSDDDVTVTTYRGLDRVLNDAGGSAFLPGGTQRLDVRWGKDYIQRFKGKIVEGVLITEPIDTMKWQWAATFQVNGYQLFRDLRFKLKLMPDSADGVMAGYVDVAHFTDQLNTSWSTHHQSYGQTSSISQHRALKRLADGFPDPKTGENTAISAAVLVKFVQVYITHPKDIVAVSKN